MTRFQIALRTRPIFPVLFFGFLILSGIDSRILIFGGIPWIFLCGYFIYRTSCNRCGISLYLDRRSRRNSFLLKPNRLCTVCDFDNDAPAKELKFWEWNARRSETMQLIKDDRVFIGLEWPRLKKLKFPGKVAYLEDV